MVAHAAGRLARWLRPPAGRLIFAQSLVPYLRRRTDDGARVQNFRLDAPDCRITRAAVLEYEEARSAASATSAS